MNYEKFKELLIKNNYNNEIEEINGSHVIRKSLDLKFTSITKSPNNLTVEGSLNLSNTKIQELPNNLTIGGDLDLRFLEITKLPDDLRVAGGVIRRYKLNNIKEGYNEDQRYILADGILWGNVTKVKKLNEKATIYKTPLRYCVMENKISGHGKTLREAMEDLTFKKLKNIEKSEIIKEIKESGKVSRNQYRAITGAYKLGTERFCNIYNISEEQETITLEELRPILVNDYGAVEFWNAIDNKEK